MFKKMDDVPVEWKCNNLKKVCTATEEAVYHGKAGWICDCGNWTRYDKDNHFTVNTGWRDVYYPSD